MPNPRSEERLKAQLTGVTKYHGRVCDRHPGLNGKRWTCDTQCIECKRERTKDRNKRQYARRKSNGQTIPM